MKILLFTTQFTSDLKELMSFQTIHGLENEMAGHSDLDVTLIPFYSGEGNVDVSSWVKEKIGKEISDFGFVFFTLMSSRSNERTIMKLDNIDRLRIGKIVYVIDYWQYDIENMNRAISTICPDILFYAYSDNYASFESMNSCWLPLAESETVFSPPKMEKKTMHFIQYGRKNSSDYEQIKQLSKNEGLKFTDLNCCSRINGLIPFSKCWRKKTAEGLSYLIGSSYFALVSYSASENMNITGDVAPITPRYYQVMLSCALPIGRFPRRESERLFDDKVHYICTEGKGVAQRVMSLLEDRREYMSLVEENYQYILNFHTYHHRVVAMKKFIEEGVCSYLP